MWCHYAKLTFTARLGGAEGIEGGFGRGINEKWEMGDLACGWWSIQRRFQPKCHRLQIRGRVTKRLFVVWSAHAHVFELMLFQEFLIELKFNSSSLQPHMYDMKQLGCFKSTLKGNRVSALCPQNYSCSFIHLDSIYQFKRLLVLHRTLAEPLEEWISATPRLSLPSLLNQQADAQVARL